jgi:hypothetical protein
MKAIWYDCVMAELKTQKNKASAVAFIGSVTDERRRADGKKLLKIFKEVTGEKAVMWGSSIVGFGLYHYKSERSSQEGDWPLTGFSPRKQSLTIYLMPGFQNYSALLKKLGKFKKSGGSCLYIQKLEDVDEKVLKEIIRRSVADMRKKYKV